MDGPGVRYVVFAQGCPLRCVYCHNPDTWSADGRADLMSVDEIVSDAVKYRSYFKFSGGGVTLTGGEPLMQKEFAADLFVRCKEEGLHTALDTSGFAPIDATIERLLAHTDLVLLDIKSINPDTFRRVAGIPIDQTLKFARYLSDNGILAWIRFVLVPGLTDDKDELHQLATYLTTLNNVEAVGILPFHQMGAYKWDDLHLDYKLKTTPEPTAEHTEQVRDIFRGYGFVVR